MRETEAEVVARIKAKANEILARPFLCDVCGIEMDARHAYRLDSPVTDGPRAKLLIRYLCSRPCLLACIGQEQA